MPKSSSHVLEIPSGQGVDKLEKALRHLAHEKSWDLRQPLPTMRELGKRFGVSYSSVCRLLKRLDTESILWRKENGRYFPAESRQVFERQKPYACLLRKLQNWSLAYNNIMGGFTESLGQDHASMLIVHNDSLVRHSDTAHPPVTANLPTQKAWLDTFFSDHERQFSGILLDDIWLDAALEQFSDRLTNAVIVCRPTAISGLSSVSIDFAASALLVVAHLYAREYQEIWIARPYAQSLPIDLLTNAVVKAASDMGKPIKPENVHSVATPEERVRFVEDLRRTKKRVGVFCPEDNVSLVLARHFAKEKISCPSQVGLMAGMGAEQVVAQGLSSLHIDFDRIGRTAGEILTSEGHQTVTVPTALQIGETT